MMNEYQFYLGQLRLQILQRVCAAPWYSTNRRAVKSQFSCRGLQLSSCQLRACSALCKGSRKCVGCTLLNVTVSQS